MMQGISIGVERADIHDEIALADTVRDGWAGWWWWRWCSAAERRPEKMTNVLT